MADEGKAVLQVWMLAAQDVAVPPITGDAAMTPERLAEMRTVLNQGHHVTAGGSVASRGSALVEDRLRRHAIKGR